MHKLSILQHYLLFYFQELDKSTADANIGGYCFHSAW